LGGELDLVARKGSVIVFSEVKTRSGTAFGEPFEAVTPSKQARIRRLAVQWLRERGPALRIRPSEIRFDVVSIRGQSLEVLEAAF
jgi:putative endonuclease